ncbi:MAG: hypothetical protein HYT16_01195 [DPANN group archaeon]|nr:hypothetical protein [DPANN group archaeon]
MTLESKLQVAENLRQILQQHAKQNRQDWWKQIARTQELLQNFSLVCNGLEKSVHDLVERNNCEIILSALDSIYAAAISGKELDFETEARELNRYVVHSQTYLQAAARGVKLQDIKFDKNTLVGRAQAELPARMQAYEENIEQIKQLHGHVSAIGSGTTRIPGAMYVLAVRTKMAAQMPLYAPGAFLGDGSWDPKLLREDGIAVAGEVKTGLLARPLAVRCEYSLFSIELSLSPTARKDSLISRAEEAHRRKQFVVECFVVDNMSRAGISTLFRQFEHPNYLPFCWNFRDEELIYNQGDARARLFKHYFDPTAETDGLRAYLDEFRETQTDSLLSLGSGGEMFGLPRLRTALRLNNDDVVKLFKKVYGREVDKQGDTLSLIG